MLNFDSIEDAYAWMGAQVGKPTSNHRCAFTNVGEQVAEFNSIRDEINQPYFESEVTVKGYPVKIGCNY